MNACPNRVSNLRPSSTIPLTENSTVYQAAAYMAAKRQDALLVTTLDGELIGIVTDRDLVYKVMAKDLDPATTLLSQIMTHDPDSVNSSDSALDALETMIVGKYRHLPVIHDPNDEYSEAKQGSVFGILDITKILYEQFEKITDQKFKSQINNITNSDLSSLLDQNSIKVPTMDVQASVKEVAIQMWGCNATGILAIENGMLSGICTTKDLMLRVLAAKLSPSTTSLGR